MSSGGPPELTFDEFRNNEARQKNRLETQDNASNSSSAGSGIRNRKSAAAAAAAENKSKTEKRIDKDDDADGDDSDTSRVGGIGDFLELPQVQSFVVCVLIADAFITIAILLLGNYIAAMDMGGMTRAGGSGSRSDSSDPEDYELLFPSQHATLLLGLLSTQGLQDLLIMCSTMSLVFFAMEISMVCTTATASDY